MGSGALDWLAGGAPVAVGVVVEAVGSAPFEPGAALYVAADGTASGAVTAGIHDAEVAAAAAALLRDEGVPRVIDLGVSDAQAQDAGLRCGGTVRVFVGRVPETPAGRAAAHRSAVAEAESRPHAVARALDGPAPGATLHVDLEDATGTLGAGPGLDAAVTEAARAGILADRGDLRAHATDAGTVTVHVAVRPTPRRLYLFGAIDYSRALAGLARSVGYDVTLADPRREFDGADPWSRAAGRDALTAHPSDVLAGLRLGPRDAVVVFTHDLALDVPAIVDALAAGAGYVGALGSRRTARVRRERLLELGVAERELERVYAPCGLDIGGVDAGESALAILAEIAAVRAGRHGGHLRDATGAIRAS